MADGLSLYRGAQLVIDCTLVSVLRGDGTPHPRCAAEDGIALGHAEKKKRERYPELNDQNGRSRLIVFGVEVGGRWSSEASTFLVN